jgi:hypothetical protein
MSDIFYAKQIFVRALFYSFSFLFSIERGIDVPCYVHVVGMLMQVSEI